MRAVRSTIHPPQSYALGYHSLSAHFGGVSENTLRKWVSMGMPIIRVGDVVLFKLSDVDDWLVKFRQGTIEEESKKPSIDDILREVQM